MRHDYDDADPQLEERFRDAIRAAWNDLQSTNEGTAAYSTAFWRYCELLSQSSEYARARKLPQRARGHAD